jgi:hypothetical protein
MPGRDTNYDNTYLTELKPYRLAIEEADDSPYSDDIPDIRADINPCKLVPARVGTGPMRYEVSARAYNAHLELYVQFVADIMATPVTLVNGLLNQLDERAHADILVWAWAEPYAQEVEGRWCLVHAQSVLTDTLIIVKDIPNTKYRVTVGFIHGANARVDLLEQHTV